ncbi:MAG: PLP-dependent transferase, partial [Methanothrix sp.]|nr:PLP-dependent transferase [Methanothrix sp.]
MKTLALRMEKQQANAAVIAERLRGNPAVGNVFYVGLPDHPGHALNARQASGAGSMISFTVKDPAWVPRILASVRLILFAESFGGVDDRLLRLSVGIEDVGDLLDDLEGALAAASG